MMTDDVLGRAYSSSRLLADLRAALERSEATGDDIAHLDFGRASRIGTPEIILAEHKPAEQVLHLAAQMLNANDRVLISRVPGNTIEALKREFSGDEVEHPERSSMVRIIRPSGENSSRHGRIAVLTAGTSDLPCAHEVRLVAEEMGVEVRVWADIGVAGLHRLVQPFREAIDWGVSAMVVVAGMDGALPSVIAGLSPTPVIGLPVSTGYGYGGNGEAALLAMLQTCAPGLTVVNIDNSVGAGIAAARIAIQSASTSP